MQPQPNPSNLDERFDLEPENDHLLDDDMLEEAYHQAPLQRKRKANAPQKQPIRETFLFLIRAGLAIAMFITLGAGVTYLGDRAMDTLILGFMLLVVIFALYRVMLSVFFGEHVARNEFNFLYRRTPSPQEVAEKRKRDE